jgi:divalent metal cation (Fe/Co/Zn/Cd) transporter
MGFVRFWLTSSPVVMPILSRAKKKVGNALNSAAMNADARQTDFCVYLSAILLVGLTLNAVFCMVGRQLQP